MGYQVSDYSVESLPLGGGIDPTVVQHTNGYQTLANGGKYEPWYVVESIKDDAGNVIYQHKDTGGTQVYSEATSTIMEYMLQDVVKSQKTSKFYENLQTINPTLATDVAWAGKTGTTDNYTDVWMMLSTPTVTLGGWAGHDDNSGMSSTSGYINNAAFTAQLVNAINAADPNIFGPGKKFTDPNKDSNVTKSKVLVSTGQKPGKVSVKLASGKTQTVNLGGATTTSFWATKSGAPTTTYDYAIGGTAADRAAGWKTILPNFNFN